MNIDVIFTSYNIPFILYKYTIIISNNYTIVFCGATKRNYFCNSKINDLFYGKNSGR